MSWWDLDAIIHILAADPTTHTAKALRDHATPPPDATTAPGELRGSRPRVSAAQLRAAVIARQR